jgi:ATP-dependent Lon protease
MLTAIVSVMTGIPLRREVGPARSRCASAIADRGLKEKLLAAARGGMKTVVIPEENANGDLLPPSPPAEKASAR